METHTELTLNCECRDSNHQVTIERYGNEDVLYIGMKLVPYLPWYKRLFVGMKYILGIPTAKYEYDCAVLNRDDVDRLHYISGRYL